MHIIMLLDVMSDKQTKNDVTNDIFVAKKFPLHTDEMLMTKLCKHLESSWLFFPLFTSLKKYVFVHQQNSLKVIHMYFIILLPFYDHKILGIQNSSYDTFL